MAIPLFANETEPLSLQGPVLLYCYKTPSKVLYIFGDIHVYQTGCTTHIAKTVDIVHFWNQLARKASTKATFDFFIEDVHHQAKRQHVKENCYLAKLRNWSLSKYQKRSFVRIHFNDSRQTFLQQFGHIEPRYDFALFHQTCLRHFKIEKQLSFCDNHVAEVLQQWMTEQLSLYYNQGYDSKMNLLSVYMDVYTMARMFRTRWSTSSAPLCHNVFVYTGLAHSQHYQSMLQRLLSEYEYHRFLPSPTQPQCLVVIPTVFLYYETSKHNVVLHHYRRRTRRLKKRQVL
jgi:hypothetical protein